MTVRLGTPAPLEKQRLASDPSLSAWVSAHAGSGKTHVLAQRVVRLLLQGAPPSRILCLTYTKAAAANMSERISGILARWSLLDDDALHAEIVAMGAGTPEPQDLAFARRLFARTVETPGGLKIQTIHAFCERLLHLFPFEANVPAHFRVLEDAERAELLARARDLALTQAVSDEGELRAALETVARLTSGASFDSLLRELLEHRDILRGAVLRDDYASRLRRHLGLEEHEGAAAIERAIIMDGVAFAEWAALASLLRQGGKNDGKLANQLALAASLAPDPSCVDEYLKVFFTAAGEPRGDGKQKMISKALQEKEPALLSRLESERGRLAFLIEKRRAAASCERSLALIALGDAILSAYERMKSQRGLFDFGDLIERTLALLQRSNPSWVLYKLDQQIEHILLDEAQDTSAPQWEILASIAREFCANDGSGARTRTFFAVGDEKQSIFSFQGAAPDKFDAMRREFEQRFTRAGLGFAPVRLTRSFRSAEGVLSAIDDIFAHGGNRHGLSADREEPPPRHEAVKTGIPALVEIWEPVGPRPLESRKDWRLPLDYVSEASPPVALAKKIARKIKSLLDPENGECVTENGARRLVEPGDVMILVRKRDSFFEAMIRALKAERIEVAGADRLDVASHIAVMDLVALGRAALLPHDDLTLATLLRSPLIGLDDGDLLQLAPRRAGFLFEALARSEKPRHKDAADKIERWITDARTRAPFDFYSFVLGAGRGRERLVARLGFEANDAIDEFLRLALAYERGQAPSLAGFLESVENLDLSIKRDMETGGGAVRVMTVHAAKGLEAKIVFLPDTCGAPSGRHDPKLFALGADGDAALAWSVGMGADPPALSLAREKLRQAAQDEHKRLLYVALTRAEERLYVCGFHGARGRAKECWHDLIREALEPSCVKETQADGAIVLRRGEAAKGRLLQRRRGFGLSVEIPAYVLTAAAVERPSPPPLRPSTALACADEFASGDGVAMTAQESERLGVGRATHALLQHLPRAAPEKREEAARRFLALRAKNLDEELRLRLTKAAIAVLENPALAPLFGANSVAEAEIAARVKLGRAEADISGRIDRLAETQTEVLIAEFKTGTPGAPKAPHLRQLALYRLSLAPLYPGKAIRCFLVFTQDAEAIEVAATELDRALAEM